jgi:F-type H+/Na+-transporting ATPase subunit alpha
VAVRADEISSIIRNEIERFGQEVSAVDVGTVIEVHDGIARVYGLGGVMASELVRFANGTLGLALNLEEETIGVVILGDEVGIKEGDQVETTGRLASVAVGDALIGRVVNGTGDPIDGKGPIHASGTRAVDTVAPNVVTRQQVKQSLATGIKALDSLIPIGRGQRELIIGDRGTGKSAIALDTIINQKAGDVLCVYVAIGQKASKVAQVVATLEAHGAMDHTVVVAANATDSAALQYLAPYAGCAIAEEFMAHGRDVLIVYDDLTKHAWAYRQISLLLRRPPGREAYPGDVFYLHSRLLERAAKLAPEYGGGSITALPIIETQANDISAYIPTNVISITDGQIYLEADLFYAGVRPAINVGLSVSRVGGSAQTKAMRRVAGRLKGDYAQYRELAAFAQFGSDLDASTRAMLDRGARTTEVLKQAHFQPMALPDEVEILFALTNGFLDDVPVNRVRAFEAAFHSYMRSTHPEIREVIESSGLLSDETAENLKRAIAEFKEGVPY